MVDAIINNPKWMYGTLTGPEESPDELDRHSFVKCSIGKENRILQCFRRTPCFRDY